ncbi:unnamed protein product, partial [Durusdinium trenchii]
ADAGSQKEEESRPETQEEGMQVWPRSPPIASRAQSAADGQGKVLNKLQHALNGNRPSVDLAVKVLVGASLIPLAWRTEQEVEEVLDSISSLSSRVLFEIEETTAQTIQITGLICKSAVLGLGIMGLWFLGRTVANRLVRAYHGNTLPAKLLEYKPDGQTSWEVSGSKGKHVVWMRLTTPRQSACACRGFIDAGTCGHIDAAVEQARMMGLGPSRAVQFEEGSVVKNKGAAALKSMGVSGRSTEALCFTGVVSKAQRLFSADESKETTAGCFKELTHGRVDEDLQHAVREKDAVAAVRAPRPKGGASSAEITVEYLKDRASQEAVIDLLERHPDSAVFLAAYSLDQPDLTKAFAKHKGKIELLADAGQTHRTKLQLQSLLEIRSGGHSVRVARGQSLAKTYKEDGRAVRVGANLKGIQHAKSCLVMTAVHAYLVLGSCNWTTSSKSNRESGLLLTMPKEHQSVRDFLSHFSESWDAGASLEEVQFQQNKTQGRSRSVRRAMSKEVAGEEEGVTLSECIADGRVPVPDKMSFPKWQAWRRKEGRRPVKRKDGRGMRTDEEVALWKAIMMEYYGEEDSEEDDDEEDEESSELEPVRGPVVVGPERAAASKAAPLMLARTGAGGSSPRPSSAGTGAADVDELLKQLQQLFRPDQEDMGALLARVTRLVMALKTLGHEVKTEDLDRVTLKAEVIQEAYDRVGTWDVRALVRTLRNQFAFVALDSNLSDEDKTLKAEVLGQVILGLGGKESSKSDKLFSTPSVEGPVLDSPTREAVSLTEVGRAGLAKHTTGGGDSPLRAKVAALEMELEALKRGSEGSVAGGDLAAALEAQTKMLQETLTARGGVTSVTSVKTDVNSPTLTDDRSEARDVAQFYEEFEDCCSLANNCKGMSYREQLIALRARCRGSRLKTYTNIYRAAWRSGEILTNPETVYTRIKEKHLIFAESKEEKEVRVDNEHVLLSKGRLSAHQFEPLFEASISELESVGLGKTQRELYLSYLRKMPPYLQKEIRSDKRLWKGEATLRGPATWEEAHRVVLEIEQREATHKATANSVLVAGADMSGMGSGQPLGGKQLLQEEKKPKPKPKAKPKAVPDASVLTTNARSTKLCFHFRDHGNCPKGDACPWSHDKELRRKALAARKEASGGKGAEQTYATKGGKGGSEGKGSEKGSGGGKGGPKGGKGKSNKAPGTVCPFFQKNGACRKGADCDMVHSLPASSSQQGGPPENWRAPSGAAMSNPFAAFSVEIGSATVKSAANDRVLSLAKPAGDRPRFSSLDDIPKDWFHLVENEAGGYQYKSVVKVLDRKVEVMLDGCAGSNHITEELVTGMLNRAADLGISPEDRRFPVLRFEKWTYPEFVHGIAAGSPVPLKGAVVLRVTLLEGEDPESARDGPEVFVRCKVASRGTSDWHGLILGGRALDHPSRMGLGFRPGPNGHVLDTLGITMPRCEDLSRMRRDRACAFSSVISSLDDSSCCEPGDSRRQLLVYDGEDTISVEAGEGAMLPVKRTSRPCLDGSLCEGVFPVEGGLEAVPGIWPSGILSGMVLVASPDSDVLVQPGDPVAEVRAGLVETSICECGLMDTSFVVPMGGDHCEACGTARLTSFDPCVECGSKERKAVRDLQGCRSCQRSFGGCGRKAGYGLMAALVAVSVMNHGFGAGGALAEGASKLEDPEVHTFLETIPGSGWWDWKGGMCYVTEVAERAFEPPAASPAFRFLSLVFRSGNAGWSVAAFFTRHGPEWAGWLPGSATSGLKMSRGLRQSDGVDTVMNPCLHIVESVDLEKMGEETPTDYYYEQLRKDLGERYPKADPFLLDHLVSLEGFLDKSIIFGFSFGVSKAEICVEHGKLLGHLIGRHGMLPDPERCQAVVDFPPLKEKVHIQQFLGCGNWLRGYLPSEFGHVAKLLGAYQKPGVEFPEGGIGSGDSEACKAFKAIKKMICDHIALATFDEASAADGSCPLEQIADASGIAVGGTVLQMSRDMIRMKILLTHSRSLTPAQQRWPPLIQEAYAQLEVKRATRKVFGTIRTLCWTDHANLTRAQSSDIGVDSKLVRWVSEILSDGSGIRSLSGRSARLGDGFSRNPKDRDALLEARTKDLSALSGQLRGFDLDEYLGEGVENDEVVAWAVGNDAVPEQKRESLRPTDQIGVAAAGQARILLVMDYKSILDDERVEESLQDEPEPGLEVDVLAMSLSTCGHAGFRSISVKILESWGKAGKEVKHTSQCETKFGELSVLRWKSASDKTNLGKGKASLPYISSWVVDSKGVVLTGHHCCREEVSRPSPLSWGVESINWHNHRVLVTQVCEAVWRTGSINGLPSRFQSLLHLLGIPERVQCWDDGDGKQSLGRRKSLKAHRVLVSFQENEEGHWDEINLARKIRLCEGRRRRTLAFAGRDDRGPRVVLWLRSPCWILTTWPDEFSGKAGTITEEAWGDRESLAREARDASGISEFKGRIVWSWLEAHPPSRIDFWELFAGQAGLTLAARQRRLSVAPPLDRLYPAFGKAWDLSSPVDQELFWCLYMVLQPAALHAGMPCEHYSVMGQRKPDSNDRSVRELVMRVLAEQEKGGRKGTVESPTGSQLWSEDDWVRSFGQLASPKPPWQYASTDGCQYGMESKGLTDGSFGQPMKKGQIWLSNFCLSEFSLRCGRPDALGQTEHSHRHIKGSVKIEVSGGTKWMGCGILSGVYEPACCHAYMSCLKRALRRSPAHSICQRVPPLEAVSSRNAVYTAVSERQGVVTSDELSAAEREQLDKEVAALSKQMDELWKTRADQKDWGTVKADLSVYQYSGQKVTEDPRRTV